MTHVHLRQETGFTLLELLLAMFIFSIVMAGTLDLLRSQGRIVSLGGDRITAEANLEFAVATMEQRLRAAGADVLPKQPNLVYAGPNVVAFNANYTTNDANDPFAVYYDPDAPAAAVIALQQWQQFTIPNTAAVYPDTTYKQGSFDSQAETIIFYLTLDSTSGRTDLYLLMQQVNSMPPEMVSRNIVGSPTTQFFQYFKVITPVVGNPYMDSVRTASLPLFHSVPIHQSAADTGLAAVIDSVRGVQVTFTVSNGQTGAAERRHTLSRFIALPNMGHKDLMTCGAPPILGVPLNVASDTTPEVKLTWNKAVDEAGGAKTVERYVVWRKLATDTSWGDPYLSIPAGAPTSYLYADGAVSHGSSYQYQLAAEDCTPTLSSPSTSLVVLVP